jgi:hypothetical protein
MTLWDRKGFRPRVVLNSAEQRERDGSTPPVRVLAVAALEQLACCLQFLAPGRLA